MVGFDEKLYILACYNCVDFYALWWVLMKNDILACYNCGDFMHCGGF